MSSSCNGDVQADCRVNMPRISTWDQKGGECAIVPGKVGDLGSKVYTTPYNVVYQRPGVTIREFNHEGLRLPQKREFLGPEFFNSGCATLYGNSRFNQGSNSSWESPETAAMYDWSFASQPYFQGNNFPPQNALAKGCGSLVNSALGWMLDSNGTPLWQTRVGPSGQNGSSCDAQ